MAPHTDQFRIPAPATPENATNKGLTWISLNSNVASVDNNGLVTAWAEGTTSIIVYTKDGNKKATCSIVVGPSGEFSVSATHKVRFSKGNLQITGDGDLYWSSTSDGEERACRLSFQSTNINFNSGDRFRGFSVRLVLDVE